jgi:tetratricopeptide (TPR) repeat protein
VCSKQAPRTQRVMQGAMNDPVVQAVVQARAHQEKGEFALAIACWLDILNAENELLPELEAELTTALQQYAAVLVQHKHSDKALWLYEHAANIATGSSKLLHQHGSLLCMLGKTTQGIAKLRAAVQEDPKDSGALISLNSACGTAIGETI